MDIPNLSETKAVDTSSKLSLSAVSILVILGITIGFWLTRLAPKTTTDSPSTSAESSKNTISADSISNAEQLKAGKLYGNADKTFSDSATGVIEKGGVNGEGTHTLIREGGASQKAALTSSAVDLDLFASKKVEVKGQTNRSNKASWLMDVGSIKILE